MSYKYKNGYKINGSYGSWELFDPNGKSIDYSENRYSLIKKYKLHLM